MPAAPHFPTPAEIRAVVVWITLQLAAIGIVVARLPLWMDSSVADRHALHIVLAANVIGSSLLVGMLMPSSWAALAVLISTIPFLQLAATLSATPFASAVSAHAVIILWLVTLWSWSTVLRSASSRAILSSVASCVSIGIAILVYLRLEFSGVGRSGETELARRLLIVIACISVAIALVVWALRRCQLIHNSAPVGG